jgi:hypothetical protein
MTPTAEELLDRLTEVREKIVRLDQKRSSLERKVLAPVQVRLDRIKEGYEEEVGPVLEQEADLIAKIKARVVEAGKTVKGESLMAVYCKPRITWEAAKLEGMMALVPGLAAARKEAESGTCQIRLIGQKSPEND